jgi:membrane-bound ClpP family serine protease
LDTTGVIALLAIIVLLAVIVIYGFNDIVIAFLLQKILEPFVRWVQRVFFGIDRVRTGDEALIGSRGIADKFEQVDESEFIGSIFAEGEKWSACSDTPIEQGASVSVVDRQDLVLVVRLLGDD